MKFIALPNIANAEELISAIIDRGRFSRVSGNIFENGIFQKIGAELESSIGHCQRIDQKNIAEILTLCKILEDLPVKTEKNNPEHTAD